ncbi:MAG TPA: hypothetical protein VMU29_11705 [Smithella sp.]|nr:hypothetical protein [Smithella sp.]
MTDYKERFFGLSDFCAFNILKYTSLSRVMRSESQFKHPYSSSLQIHFKINYLLHYCKGKRVVHFGFVDSPFTGSSVNSKTFLHSRLRKECEELFGIDHDANAVLLYSRVTGDSNVAVGDIYNIDSSIFALQNADIFLLGEILEHLSNPGIALQSIYNSMPESSELIITVPNAFGLSPLRGALKAVEIVHHDHVCWYSIHTLTTLLSRHHFRLKNICYYAAGEGERLGILNRAFPSLSDGIIGIFQKQAK